MGNADSVDMSQFIVAAMQQLVPVIEDVFLVRTHPLIIKPKTIIGINLYLFPTTGERPCSYSSSQCNFAHRIFLRSGT